MDNNEVEQSLTPETLVSEEQVPPKKKIRFGSILVIFLIVLVVLGAAAFAGYKYLRSSPQLQNISRDALMVARVDMPKLIKKAGLTELKKGSENEDLLEALEELNMEALIKDPKSTGIFTLKPAYYFMEYVDRDSLLLHCLVFPIADGVKFGKFLKGITLPRNEEFDVETKGKYQTLDLPNASFVWSKNTAVLVISPAENNEECTKRAVKLLDQPSSQSIKANKYFSSGNLAKHDLALWLNIDMLASIAEKGFKEAKPRIKEIQEKRADYYEKVSQYRAAQQRYYQQVQNYYASNYYYYDYPQFNAQYPVMDFAQAQNIFERILLDNVPDSIMSTDDIIKLVSEFRGSSYLAYLDFSKGRIQFGVDSDYSPTQEKKYGKIMHKIGDTKKLAKYLPQERLFATGIFQGSWDEAWKVFGKQVNKLTEARRLPEDRNNPDNMKEDQLLSKNLKVFCEGNLMASLNVGTGNNKSPFVSIAGMIRKNKGIVEILKQLDKDKEFEKSGNVYKEISGLSAFVLNDDIIVWTSNYKQYKKSSLGLDSKSTRIIKSTPLGAFINLNELLELAADELDMDKDAEDILEQIAEARLLTKMHKGLPSSIQTVVSLKENKKNSLKVIWEMLNDKVKVFENLDDILASISNLKEVEPNDREYPDTLVAAPAPAYDY